MINSLSLKNFQCHKNLKLELVPGINVVLGKTDSGKSAILRALYYTIFNKPASNNYPSSWIKNEKNNLIDECKITVEKNNSILHRYKNKDENGYIIDNKKLKAINRDVPEQVQDFFNISSVNFQRQLDSHFLLSETSGQIAKYLNELIDLEDIDLYLSAVEKLKRSTNKEQKQLEKDIEETQVKIEEYNWLQKAKKINNNLQNVIKQKDTAGNIIYDLQKTKKNSELYQQKFKNIPDIEKAHFYIIEMQKIKQNILEVENTITIIKKQFNNNIQYKQKLNKMPDTGKAHNFISKINLYKNKIDKVKTIYNKMRESFHDNEYYISEEKRLANIIVHLKKKIPDICPLCGNLINKKDD